MYRKQRIFIIRFCIFGLITFSAIAADAQQIPPSYGFLEVDDYKNQPVADASVRVLNRIISEKHLAAQGYLIGTTNSQGLLEKGIEVGRGNYQPPFLIDKSGFYPFIDCFGLFDFLGYGWRNNKDKPLKIELLVIPQTKSERKAIGDEQLKRELFLAIYNNDLTALDKLLEAKISPNLTTAELRGVPINKNLPAIVYAANLGNTKAIKILLDRGAKVREKNSAAYNILVNYLLADPFYPYYPQTAEAKTARINEYENGVEILIKAGANLDARDERSLLLIAAEKGYARTVETLLEKSLSANKQNPAAINSALLTAVRYRQLETVRIFLKNKTNPNFLVNDVGISYDNGCASPLIIAAENADLKMAKLLVENGADVNPICKNGTSALSKALYRGQNFYYDKTQQQEVHKVVDLIFDAGLNVAAANESGMTLLMTAVQYSNYPTVERLIKAGVPVNAKTNRGETALMLAAGAINRLKMVKLLIAAGAEVNASYEYTNDYQGNSYYFCYTPLINAAVGTEITDEANDLTEVMEILAANGANVNYKCANGENALTMAARSSAVKGIEKLIQLGADVKGKQGSLALKYAREGLKGFSKDRAERVVARLEAAGAK